ncbi:hypothetical protein [Deinococcus sp. 6GRE01]|uniref:hypothetical protein n=1 Tax=Deinococcus sp. 6GRE01 TaxID=2745873 RepID=UPI001E3B56CC|nr:hypothetical protein [Deinococcus sp. 6GRE01]MCD0156012.1 hypothetical protein [Deinococcus sp. 6GRE01]
MPKIDIENSRLGFAQIRVEVDGKEILLKSVSYGDAMERSQIEGNAQMSLGMSAGMYKADDGEIEVYADEFAELVEAFGEKFYTKPFDISVTFEPEGTTKLTKDEIIGCRWNKRGVSDQTGSDALTRTLGYTAAYVKFGGKNPLPNMPDGAK